MGSNLQQVDQRGQTLLHTAAKQGSGEIVRFLINRGVQLNVRDNQDRTPLAVADGEAKKLLQEYGAK